jgi:hypothetical protein
MSELVKRLRFCRDFHGMVGYPENSKLFGEAAECIASRDAEVERLKALNAEMLETLEELIEGHLRWVDLGDGIRISGPSPGQWEAARAIIAKARGQKPVCARCGGKGYIVHDDYAELNDGAVHFWRSECLDCKEVKP